MGSGVVVLVDFENVQAIDFARLRPAARLAVFAGEGQRKVPIEVAMGLQAMGERARWVKASGAGPNALDFHIAFELGRMVQAGERGPVVVLSKDKGFDPLLAWLSAETGIRASRASSIENAFWGTSPADGAPIAIDPGTVQAICVAASDATRDGDEAGAPAAPPLPAFPSVAALAPEAPAAAPASRAASAIVATQANGAPRERLGAATAEAARPHAPAPVASPAGAPKASAPAGARAAPTKPKPAAEAASGAESDAEKAKEILGRSSKVARPRRRTTLATHIKSMLRPRELRDAEVEAIIARLVSKR
ncbi:PIN domain-containing protein [Cupriavidus sp. D39]|uniref:PIN domain-containing protein n=1 Tax=Cupriavidus sp. D39 TaxID=2997877 RepID=UPI00226DA9A0|nr:PIN domain-containing protein [Cupriavidus sp. D39]MCY0856876.1 PIN domain-containing protein [Cupriavidus sp. D39]